MKRLTIHPLLLLLLAGSGMAQAQKQNQILIARLDAIYREDQAYRQ